MSPKTRSKDEERARKRAYRQRRRDVPTQQDVPTEGTNVPTQAVIVSPPTAERVPPLAHVDPAAPLMAPYSFVPNWVTNNLGPPSAAAEQAWLAHVANTLTLTGRTPAENARERS